MLINNQLILTRYLYIKDEVKIALLMSILEKKRDSLFWGYELYYSGFQKEVFEFLWTIYFDFFASLNPSFELYFLKKEKEWVTSQSDIILAVIIENLLIRPFNTDIFMLYQINSKFELEINYLSNFDESNVTLLKQIHFWITTKDYYTITNFIFEHTNNKKNTFTEVKIYELFIDSFEQIQLLNSIQIPIQKQKLIKQFEAIIKRKPIISKKILLTKIMSLFIITTKIQKGKNLYMHVDPTEIILYETYEPNETQDIRPYRILKNSCLLGINEIPGLCLFQLEQNSIKDLRSLYNNDWLFYAYYSPIWMNRIQKFQGKQNQDTLKIVFKNEDLEELFYNKYNYEPDEQPQDVKNKTIPEIKTDTNWIEFQNKYNKNGIICIVKEELEELMIDKVKII